MASSSSSTEIRAAKSTITLRSSDGHTFELEKAVAIQSPKLNKIIAEDRPDHQVIQIPSATTKTLSQVVDYLNKHAAASQAGAPPSLLAVSGGGGGGGAAEEEVKVWDDEFVKDVEGNNGVLDLIAAANYLEIKSLLDLLCRAVAADVIDDCELPRRKQGNTRAWAPDDALRPTTLPSLSMKQQQQQPPCSCPICCEDLDVTDSSFLPCPCGFRLCLFCHKRILELDGRCPGCRKHYDSVSSEHMMT